MLGSLVFEIRSCSQTYSRKEYHELILTTCYQIYLGTYSRKEYRELILVMLLFWHKFDFKSAREITKYKIYASNKSFCRKKCKYLHVLHSVLIRSCLWANRYVGRTPRTLTHIFRSPNAIKLTATPIIVIWK